VIAFVRGASLLPIIRPPQNSDKESRTNRRGRREPRCVTPHISGEQSGLTLQCDSDQIGKTRLARQLLLSNDDHQESAAEVLVREFHAILSPSGKDLDH
jgi:hypothetical protein